MKKTIITIPMTVAMAAFLSVGCGGESAPTEPTEADKAEGGQATANEKAGDPSNEDSNNAEFGSKPKK